MEGEKDTQTQSNNLNRLKEKQQELPLVEPLIESLHIIQQLTQDKRNFKKSLFILIGVLIGCITLIICVFIVAVSFAPTDITVKNESYSNSSSEIKNEQTLEDIKTILSDRYDIFRIR